MVIYLYSGHIQCTYCHCVHHGLTVVYAGDIEKPGTIFFCNFYIYIGRPVTFIVSVGGLSVAPVLVDCWSLLP